MIEQIERLYTDDRVIALLDFEVLLKAEIDTVVLRATETVALDDVIPITGVIGDLRKRSVDDWARSSRTRAGRARRNGSCTGSEGARAVCISIDRSSRTRCECKAGAEVVETG